MDLMFRYYPWIPSEKTLICDVNRLLEGRFKTQIVVCCGFMDRSGEMLGESASSIENYMQPIAPIDELLLQAVFYGGIFPVLQIWLLIHKHMDRRNSSAVFLLLFLDICFAPLGSCSLTRNTFSTPMLLLKPSRPLGTESAPIISYMIPCVCVHPLSLKH